MRYVYSNEIYHYGIPGMKWGIRRFQNPDGTLTAAGRRRYGTVENLERGITKQQADEHDEAKKAAINSGKASEVQKFSSELTREEMAYAVQRIRDEQTLSDLRAKDVVAGQQRVKAIIDAGGQLKTAGETVKSVYNLVAQVNNAFNKNKLPIIGNQENDKKGDKPLSVEDQSKLFKLEQDKKRAATEERIDDLIQKKGVNYIRDNPDKFTAEELQRALEYKKAAESDKWGRSNTSNSNSSSGRSSSSSTSSDSSKSGNSNKTENGIKFVKESLDNEGPFSQFRTIPHYKNGGEVDSKGLIFTKVFPSREAAYKAYKEEHPNSKLSETEFMEWLKED